MCQDFVRAKKTGRREGRWGRFPAGEGEENRVFEFSLLVTFFQNYTTLVSLNQVLLEKNSIFFIKFQAGFKIVLKSAPGGANCLGIGPAGTDFTLALPG
jgi:hypothetical protein